MDNNNNIQEQPVQQRRAKELLQRQRQRMEVLKESVATKAIEEEEDKDAVLSASNNSRLVESLKNEINVQKEKYEDTYKELDALNEEKKRRKDAIRILEWERSRNKEVVTKLSTEYENKLEELRRDSEERLLAVVDKTKKTTRIQLNNQMQHK